MKTSFRGVAMVSAAIFLTLALTWILAPDVLPSSWGVDLANQANLVGRRSAALYAGLGVMFLLARNAAPSPARTAMLRGAFVTCLLLAALGTAELVNNHARPDILAAVAIDTVLAVALLHAARTR
jgi:hypothetical protein